MPKTHRLLVLSPTTVNRHVQSGVQLCNLSALHRIKPRFQVAHSQWARIPVPAGFFNILRGTLENF